MTSETYEELLERAGRLPPAEQLRLLEGLAVLVRQRIVPEALPAQHSIMELEGLGQEVWRDEHTGELIDAQEYVNQERASWRG